MKFELNEIYEEAKREFTIMPGPIVLGGQGKQGLQSADWLQRLHKEYAVPLQQEVAKANTPELKAQVLGRVDIRNE